MESGRYDKLTKLMTLVAGGDRNGAFVLRLDFDRELKNAVRRAATEVGRKLPSDEVEAVATDFCTWLVTHAGAWRPGGALPWRWAAAHLEALVRKNQGFWPLTTVEPVEGETPEALVAVMDDQDLLDTVARLAAVDERVADLLFVLGAASTRHATSPCCSTLRSSRSPAIRRRPTRSRPATGCHLTPCASGRNACATGRTNTSPSIRSSPTSRSFRCSRNGAPRTAEGRRRLTPARRVAGPNTKGVADENWARRPMCTTVAEADHGTRSAVRGSRSKRRGEPMNAIVTPTTSKSTVKHFSVVAAVLVAALVVVIVLAISVWASSDSGGSDTPTRGNVVSTQQPVQSLNALSPELQSVDVSPAPQSPQSVNALSPELPASAIAHWSQAEGLSRPLPGVAPSISQRLAGPAVPAERQRTQPGAAVGRRLHDPASRRRSPRFGERRRMSPDRPVLNESTATHGPDGRSGPPARGGRGRASRSVTGGAMRGCRCGGADDEPHVDRAGGRASTPRCCACDRSRGLAGHGARHGRSGHRQDPSRPENSLSRAETDSVVLTGGCVDEHVPYLPIADCLRSLQRAGWQPDGGAGADLAELVPELIGDTERGPSGAIRPAGCTERSCGRSSHSDASDRWSSRSRTCTGQIPRLETS